MEIQIKMDKTAKVPRVIIETAEMTDEVSALFQKLSEQSQNLLIGFFGDEAAVLDASNISRVYAENGKVFAACLGGPFLLKIRLYEAEQRLPQYFVRISNSEIINLKKAERFDLSRAGTICVRMVSKETVFVSRRYVSKIKSVLGI